MPNARREFSSSSINSARWFILLLCHRRSPQPSRRRSSLIRYIAIISFRFQLYQIVTHALQQPSGQNSLDSSGHGWRCSARHILRRTAKLKALIGLLKTSYEASPRTSYKLWSSFLLIVEFAINNAAQASTGLTPFFVKFGRHPRVPALLGLKRPHLTPNTNFGDAEAATPTVKPWVTHPRRIPLTE